MELVKKLPNLNTIYNPILTDCLPFYDWLPVTLRARYDMFSFIFRIAIKRSNNLDIWELKY